MDYIVKEGDYAKMGANVRSKDIVFTFAGEKEDQCAIVLVNRKTNKEIEIEVSDTFCLGSLRSVKVEGISPKEYDYYFQINGKKQLDPYAKAIHGREVWNDTKRKDENYQVLCAFYRDHFDWTGDKQPEIPRNQMILYKLHVRGFSMDRRGNSATKGTFRGILERIPYLKSLGITTVEIMPPYEFEEMDIPVKQELPEYINWEPDETDMIQPEDLPVKEAKLNYWGYGEGNYFSVKASYAKNPEHAPEEFKKLVRSFHENGMECVLEMYFPEKVNHNLILDALRYWVREFHVDGFHLLGENLPITAVVQDVLLSRTKIFYTEFHPSVIREDKKYKNLFVYKEEYQYPARKILNHINGDMVEFINQQKKQSRDFGFVNFICSNNGFTLADLFMYNDRHNEANGEENMDGNSWNFSNNYGVEGPTKKKFVTASRRRQWRNAILMLFLAQGVPMLWSGDEMENSQSGNNNAYCQDNPIGWLNWSNERSHKANIDFIRNMIAFRKSHTILSSDEPFHFNDYETCGFPDLSFHGENAWISGFDYGRMNLGLMYCGAYSSSDNQEDVYVGYNFFSAVTNLALPQLAKGKKWYLVVDSFQDQTPFLPEPKLLDKQQVLAMKPQSICVLIGK